MLERFHRQTIGFLEGRCNRSVFLQYELILIVRELAGYIFIVHDERKQIASAVRNNFHRYLHIPVHTSSRRQRLFRTRRIKFYAPVQGIREIYLVKKTEFRRNHNIPFAFGYNIRISRSRFFDFFPVHPYGNQRQFGRIIRISIDDKRSTHVYLLPRLHITREKRTRRPISHLQMSTGLCRSLDNHFTTRRIQLRILCAQTTKQKTKQCR